MAGRAVIFRCDGSSEIGFGHLMRCLTLAGDFISEGAGPIHFVSRRLSPSATAKLETAGFVVHWLEPHVLQDEDLQCTIDVCRGEDAVLITDSHDFSEEYYVGLKSAGLFVVSVDDIGTPRYASDVVVNHHINAHNYTFRVGPSTRLLLGPQYLPLRKEFRRWLGITRTRGDSRWVVSLGGMPEPDHLRRVLAGLDRPAMRLKVIPGFGAGEEQCAQIRECCPNAEVIDPAADLAAAFAEADAAVVNGSVTAYEAAALGIPLIMIPMDPNQEDAVRGFEDAGACIALPSIETLKSADVAAAAERLMANRGLMETLSARAGALVDGRGGERIVRETAEHRLEKACLKPWS